MQPTASMRRYEQAERAKMELARHRELMAALRQIAILLGLIAGAVIAIIVVAIIATHGSP
jgi:type IV secretory pathway TrbD component